MGGTGGSSLPELLRTWRERALLTQEQLAAHAGLSVRTVRGLESACNGRRPRTESLKLLADALRLTDTERARFIAAARGDPEPKELVRQGIPRQLPNDLIGFAGRTTQLRELDALLDGNGSPPTTAVISVIAGTAGVGKTSLAVHWGHHVADRFPDGQLYADLRGFGPGEPVLHPDQVLRGFLRALGLPPGRIAVDEHDLPAAFRTAMFGRRMLILLDNAHDADQVRPLLPGGAGCLTIVTSRAQLRGLSITDGAYLMTLDLLTAEDALELLIQRLGPHRVAAHPTASAQIIDFCTRLPLALSTVAANAASQPKVPLAVFAGQLADVRDRLDALDTGEATTQLRAVFSWSYRRLTDEAARLFRLLGLHPGPDIGVDAAASLADRPMAAIRPLLTELTLAHLVTEQHPGRYGFHDLLRAYAIEQGADDDSATRDAACYRMLDHYLLTAIAAARLLNPRRVLIAPPHVERGVTVTKLGDISTALAWFRAERSALIGAVDMAAPQRGHRAWQLAWSAVDYLDRQGQWPEWVATQETALIAARREDDVEGQAHMHRGLGRAKARMGHFDDAYRHLGRALALFRGLGHRPLEARTHLDLSELLGLCDKHEAATPHAQDALDLYVALDDQAGQARALNAVGWDHAQLGFYEQALAYCQQSLALHQKAGDRSGQAAVWDSLGYIHQRLGNSMDAITCYTTSREIYHQLGDRFHESDALCLLADIHYATGGHADARRTWKMALKILEELRHPSADQIKAKLAL